ncbi:hypothetical protein ACC703_38865, partial [Rhizobium ruizarguesonis]
AAPLPTSLSRAIEAGMAAVPIDLAARETEAESLKFRVNALSDERDTLRQDVTLLQKRAKDAEQKLTQQQHMVIRLEDKAERESDSA